MALPERPLVGRIARPAGSHAIRADPQIVTRQRMAVLAVCLAQVPLILGGLVQALCGQATVPARSGAGGVVPGCVLAQQLPFLNMVSDAHQLVARSQQPYAELTTLRSLMPSGSLVALRASLMAIVMATGSFSRHTLCLH
jgi:hypothetical protein